MEANEISQLRVDLQDMHHYAALISGKAWSTFEGDSEYDHLSGNCAAYGRLYERISRYEIDNIPALRAFLILDLKALREIRTQAELKHEARRAFAAVQDVARNYEVRCQHREQDLV